MALSVPSKPARGRPTIGRKMAFHVPLPAAKNANQKNLDETDRVFCRMYCKDSVGFFLGLPLANYRKLLTDPAGSIVNLPNQGDKVIRAVADRTSARPYTITLEPGTLVKQAQYVWYSGVNQNDNVADEIELKTLQFYLPAYMPVWRILDWLAGKRENYDMSGGPSATLPGMTFLNYGKIIALTTPNERTYPLESILYQNRVPPPIAGSLDAPGPAQQP